MASHSEIAVVESTEKAAKPEAKTGKTRRAAPLMTAKHSTARKRANVNNASETQPAGRDVVPVMKLRAIDIVDDETSDGSGAGKTTVAEDAAPEVIPIPSFGFASAADKTMENGAGTDPETGSPTPTDDAPRVTDPELLELLEQLSTMSTTIVSANSVLDAASGLPAELAAGASAESEPAPETAPQAEPEPEPESDDPPPPAHSVSPSPSLLARARAAFRFDVMVNTALAAMAFIAGAVWLVYANSWVPETTPGAPVKLEQTERSRLAKDQSAPAPRVQTPKSTAAVAGPAQTSLTPPAPQPLTTASPQIEGAAGQPIALGIDLPATANQTEISIMVQGVPETATLSAGKKLGAGNWLLNDTQLHGLTLDTADGFAPGTYELEVIFVRSDGKVPETRKVMLTVQPAAVTAAAAPVTGQPRKTAKPVAANMQTTLVNTGVAVEIPAAAPGQAARAPAKQTRVTVEPIKPTLTPQETRTILTRGGTLLHEGDVAGARLLFEYAAERGSKKAMVMLAESYDAKSLRKLGVRGIQPDDTQAAHWYQRASAAQ